MSIFWIVILGLLSLGIVVLVHEFGHYITAKWQDVEVEASAIGMGPALFTYTYGETEYRLCVLPLGGYVKMAGEEIGEREEENDNPRAFHNKSVWGRVVILVAGGLFNIALGYLLYIPYGIAVGEQVIPARVGYVSSDMPADGKLRIGDEILSINGEKVETFQEVSIKNQLLGDKTRTFVVRRNEQKRIVRIDPVRTTQERFNQDQLTYLVGIQPYIEPVIHQVNSGSWASRQGLKPGDRLVQFGDTTVKSFNQFQQFITNHSGTYTLVFSRDNTRISGSINVPGDEEQLRSWISNLGFAPKPFPQKTHSFVNSFGYAFERTVKDFELMLNGIIGLVTQRLSFQQMAGPVGIISMTGQIAMMGFWRLLRFTALISINLGVINLLPIPVLDGGHVFLMLPEILIGKKLPDRIIGVINQVGVLILISFFVFITFVDLRKFETFQVLFQLFGM